MAIEIESHSQKTIEELRQYDLFEIKIKDSMLDEPLFLAFQEGGRHFSSPQKPMGARNITAFIKVVTENAGLPPGTAYCFRRGAANDVCSWPYQLIIPILT